MEAGPVVRRTPLDPRGPRGGTPLVSVGMPVRDGAPYVQAAVEAVLAQDIGDLELVISDNASTDATEQICRELAAADPRVRYVRQPTNRGAAWNYNAVLHLSRGTYFHWAAADDVFEPSYLRECVTALEADPGASLAFASTVVVDARDVELRRWGPRPGYARAADPASRFRDVLWQAVMCFEVFGVARRATLLRTPGIAPFTGSDRPLLAELALRGRFHHVDAPLFRNRVHDRDSMHRHPHPRSRAAWFDPRSRVRFPHWRLLSAFVAAAWRGPERLRDRARALAVLPPWAVREKGALADDVLDVLLGARSRRSRRLRAGG